MKVYENEEEQRLVEEERASTVSNLFTKHYFYSYEYTTRKMVPIKKRASSFPILSHPA